MAEFPGNEVKPQGIGNGESSASFHCFRHNRAVEMWTFLSNCGQANSEFYASAAPKHSRFLG